MKNNTHVHSIFRSPFSHSFQIALIFLLLLLVHSSVFADSQTHQKRILTKRIQEEKKSLDQHQREILLQEKRIKELNKEEKTIFLRLETVNSKIQLSASQIRLHKKQLKINKREKRSVQKRLTLLKNNISDNKALLAENLKNLYKGGRFSYLKILFSADSFTDFLLRVKYSKSLAEMEVLLIDKMKGQKKELENAKKTISAKEKKIETIVLKISKRKKAAVLEKKGKNKLLREITLKRENYLQLKKEAEEASKKLHGLVDLLEKKRKKIVAQTKIKKKGTFKSQKGVLPWPLKGKVISRFGKSMDKRFKVQSVNNGIEIRAKKGTSVLSVHKGAIIFSNWFRGYGKLVIVDNDNGYYTLYGHLSEIWLSENKQVEEGDILGKAGDTGSIHGSTLYFEIRKGGKPVNPLKWLSARK